MNQPNQALEVNGGAMDAYKARRNRYLGLCRRYGLNPFDLDIISLSFSRLPRRDKIQIVRLILTLIKLERALKDVVASRLFPLTVEESERSGYLVPTQRLRSEEMKASETVSDRIMEACVSVNCR